jgi:hypothetical protein
VPSRRAPPMAGSQDGAKSKCDWACIGTGDGERHRRPPCSSCRRLRIPTALSEACVATVSSRQHLSTVGCGPSPCLTAAT